VRQAREQSVDTAGVQAGGEIPDYLADQGTAILAALKRRETAPAPEAAAAAVATKPAEPAIDQKRLERLEKTEPTATTPEPEPDLDADAQAAKEAANVKLSNLVGKK
ncbi:MAG TPA: hypothetical protein PLT23_08815, partial [Lentisphaeria bacterium]|nr:hypothetical protein [Lentisphaeria bacterium]